MARALLYPLEQLCFCSALCCPLIESPCMCDLVLWVSLLSFVKCHLCNDNISHKIAVLNNTGSTWPIINVQLIQLSFLCVSTEQCITDNYVCAYYLAAWLKRKKWSRTGNQVQRLGIYCKSWHYFFLLCFSSYPVESCPWKAEINLVLKSETASVIHTKYILPS